MTVTAKSLGLGTGATLLAKEVGADLISALEVCRLAMPLQYAGDPTNNVVPDFEGQLCTDTTTNETYFAKGITAADWQQLAQADLDGLTATATELNMAADNSANVETVAAANIITAAESGKTFFLSSTTEFASTLPAPAAGLRYTFIIAAAPSGASYTITTNASANIIVGQAVSAEDAAGSVDFEATGCDLITFADGKAVIGDRVEVISDGTKWYATGACSVQDAITFTTAS